MDGEGGVYMRRWWCLPDFCLRIDENGHLFPKKWVRWAPRVHHIVREDRDDHLHDHPFPFRTFILNGWYDEEDIFGAVHRRSEGQTRKANAETFHRINAVSEGGVWTLFVCGKRVHEWGFLVDSRKVGWRAYFQRFKI